MYSKKLLTNDQQFPDGAVTINDNDDVIDSIRQGGSPSVSEFHLYRHARRHTPEKLILYFSESYGENLHLHIRNTQISWRQYIHRRSHNWVGVDHYP